MTLWLFSGGGAGPAEDDCTGSGAATHAAEQDAAAEEEAEVEAEAEAKVIVSLANLIICVSLSRDCLVQAGCC